MTGGGLAGRIVALLPSATEIVAALGQAERLVGRSHECDFPAAVAVLPALTEPKLDISLPSGDLDRRIKALVEQALSVYRVDAERLRTLDPDVVVTQTQCAVCAVDSGELDRALGQWTGARPRIVALSASDLAGLWDDIARVADALDVAERGRDLIAELRGRIAGIAGQAEPIGEVPTVVSIEWIEPLMAGGNWMPELVALAGGRELLGEPGTPSRWIAFDELAAADPEVILIQPCGFGIDRTRAELGPLASRSGWSGLSAVKRGRAYLTDGHHYFNRPGPRLVESLEILAEILHPALFDFGHRGTGWQKL